MIGIDLPLWIQQLGLLIAIVIEARQDAKNPDPIKYLPSNIMRFFIVLITSLVVASSVGELMILGLLGGATYLLFFDYLYNAFRGKDWWYLGARAQTDQILTGKGNRWIRLGVQLGIYIYLLVAMIFI